MFTHKEKKPGYYIIELDEYTICTVTKIVNPTSRSLGTKNIDFGEYFTELSLGQLKELAIYIEAL